MTRSTNICRIRRALPQVEGATVRLSGEWEVPGQPPRPIFFEFTSPDPRRARPAVRPFLLAALVPAMRAGLPLALDGPVDALTRANLMEWQAAFANWRPDQLRVVPILAPDGTVPPDRGIGGGKAITAFSGGVDSCFTVYRQTLPSGPDDRYRRVALGAGLMIHGFDIALDQEAVFESALRNSAALLEAFGLPLFRLRTNLRTFGRETGCDWETEGHGIWLAASLACLEPWFDGLVIPSTYPYSRMKLPWGSNPVTDPLLGGDRAPCWHDGGDHHKLAKVLTLATHPAVAGRVRVCWQGRQLDRNCGRCFKCITTQVCFWLAGVARPPAFPVPCGLAEVARLPVKNAQNDYLLGVLEARARREGRRDLVRALRQARATGRLRRGWRALRHAFSRRLHP